MLIGSRICGCTTAQLDPRDRGKCGVADHSGTCKSKPTSCPKILDPVCGCDGKKYENACFANRAGVSAAACPK